MHICVDVCRYTTTYLCGTCGCCCWYKHRLFQRTEPFLCGVRGDVDGVSKESIHATSIHALRCVTPKHIHRERHPHPQPQDVVVSRRHGCRRRSHFYLYLYMWFVCMARKVSLATSHKYISLQMWCGFDLDKESNVQYNRNNRKT